jgi:hypothetical protein
MSAGPFGTPSRAAGREPAGARSKSRARQALVLYSQPDTRRDRSRPPRVGESAHSTLSERMTKACQCSEIQYDMC